VPGAIFVAGSGLTARPYASIRIRTHAGVAWFYGRSPQRGAAGSNAPRNDDFFATIRATIRGWDGAAITDLGRATSENATLDADSAIRRRRSQSGQ
jgi:hypothetical protein